MWCKVRVRVCERAGLCVRLWYKARVRGNGCVCLCGLRVCVCGVRRVCVENCVCACVRVCVRGVRRGCVGTCVMNQSSA